MAVSQLAYLLLMYRYRRQASSHSEITLFVRMGLISERR
jgi:hypothetical protein